VNWFFWDEPNRRQAAVPEYPSSAMRPVIIATAWQGRYTGTRPLSVGVGVSLQIR
jgi:hypothetical protein